MHARCIDLFSLYLTRVEKEELEMLGKGRLRFPLSWLSMGKYFAGDGSVDVDVMD